MADKESFHLLHVFPSFEVGGIQARAVAILNNLGDRFRHSVVALNGDYSCAERISTNVKVDLMTDVTSPHNLLQSLTRARTTLRRSSPDLLLSYNWGSLDWSLANSILPVCPHIHHEDGFDIGEADRQFRRRILYRRFCLPCSDLLIVPSENLQGIALHSWKQPASKIRVIPNGVDWREFAAVPNSAAAEKPALVLGTVGPLRPEKNIGILLPVVAQLSKQLPLQLVIVGDGPERTRLEALAADLGIADRCRFDGLRRDIAAALAPIDIFLMPSKTEQMPISLLQAMASAKPVVAYDVGDISKMVSAQNAPYIVPRDDEQALVRCLQALASNEALRLSIGASNLKRVQEQYSESAMIERHLSCYNELLSTKH